MVDEYNILEDEVGFIDGNMNLSDESPLEKELSEHRAIKRLNEKQLTNLVYEMTLNMLNEDDLMAGAMDPQAPGTMPPAATGAMPPASSPIEDADKNVYKDNANKKKEEIAKKVGDTTGGAPGFNPKDEADDKDKKQLAKQVAENIIKQLTRDFAKKK